MSDVAIYWVAKYKYEKNWGVRRHNHEFFQFYYVVDGNSVMSIANRDIQIKTNMFILIKPSEDHEIYKMKQGYLIYHDIKFNILDERLKSKVMELPTLYENPDERILEKIVEVRREWKSKCLYSKDMCAVLIQEILLLMLSQMNSNQFKDIFGRKLLAENFNGITRQIVEYIEMHYTDDFELAALADHLSYNKNYLCKVFKNTTAFTIKEYVNYLRIQKAVELICQTDLKLIEVSERVGFKNIYHFNRVFKNIAGYTPGEVRRQEKDGLYSDIQAHGQFHYRYFEKD